MSGGGAAASQSVAQLVAGRVDANYLAVYPGGVPVAPGGYIDQQTTALNSPAGATATLRFKDVQWTHGLPAAEFGAQLTWLCVVAGGIVANNANAKSVRLAIGATVILTIDPTVSKANLWHLHAWIGLREFATGTVSVTGYAVQGPDTPTFALPAVREVAGLDLTAPLRVATTVAQVAAADVVQDWWSVHGGGGVR